MKVQPLVLAMCLASASVVECCTSVSSVDLDSYVGHWYQPMTNLAAAIFNPFSVCTQATYGKVSDTQISVNNTGQGRVFGSVFFITGHADVTNTIEPGQLDLYLSGVPAVGSYWIIKLGPVVNGAYQYAVVSDKDCSALYVLALDPVAFEVNYKPEVDTFLIEQGFTGVRKRPNYVNETTCPYISGTASANAVQVE